MYFSLQERLNALADPVRVLDLYHCVKHIRSRMLRKVNIVSRKPLCRTVFFLGAVQILKAIAVVQVVVYKSQQSFHKTGFFIIQTGQRCYAKASIVDALRAEGLKGFVP